MAELTKGAIVYTQIVNYTEEGIPLVHCYVVVGPQVSVNKIHGQSAALFVSFELQNFIFLNEELVSRGYADWSTTGCQSAEEVIEGAVGGAEL